MPIRRALIAFLFPAIALAADPTPPARDLRSFDFEERLLGNPEDLPMHWSKADGPLFPHYVNGRLTNDRARSGQYSFRFDLNGGSLVYRYDAGRIKVLPRSHYRVETHVQTTALVHARARLTAYFVDADGRPIKSSIRHSDLYAARSPDDAWQHLEVELSTDRFADSLVIELGLLQPQAFAAENLGQQTLFPQDIRGSAWFDDVIVSQVPRVQLSTDRPGNIFRRGEPLAVQVLVNDRSTDDLAAQLVITSADGKRVYQRSGALDINAAENLGPGRKRSRLPLPNLPPGWYQASLLMTSRGQFVGRQTLDLVHLADNAPHPRPDSRFGIIATDLPFDGWKELPDFLPFLAAGRVKLAVWSKAGEVQQIGADFDKLLVSFRELGITPTACLIDLPPGVARNLTNPTWTQLLAARGEDWKPQLAYLISRHASYLEHWQLGADGIEDFVSNPQMRQVYDAIYGEFEKLIQRPDLAMPWPAFYELSGRLPATVALSVHPSILPSQIPLYMQELRSAAGGSPQHASPHNLSLTLHLLNREKYGRDVQIRDLAQRVIYALSADAQRIDFPLPITVAHDGDDIIKQPQEMLIIIRTLTTTLGGATFKGKVPIAEGVEAFLFERAGQGILALWDKGTTGGVKTLALNLGQRPRAIDLWGNVTPLLRPKDSGNQSGQVQLTVGPMPIFLLDIDGYLAQFRASVALDRPLVESSFQAHKRRIRFINPYRTAISGALKLKGPAGWTINPPTFNFNLNPNETFEREISIEFPYNSYAGPKTIQAQFSLQADRPTNLTVPLTITLGLTDVGMQTLAIRDGKDLLIQQIITNYGEKPIDYTAFAIVPGQAREERLVTNLAPGKATIKLYRFQNAKIKDGATVRTGVKELVGTRILNEEIEIQ